MSYLKVNCSRELHDHLKGHILFKYARFFEPEADRGTVSSRLLASKNYGCILRFSDADLDDPREQIEDAVKFLELNSDAIKSAFTEDDSFTVVLAFSIGVPVDGSKTLGFSYFPPKLLGLCSDVRIGIVISCYPIDGQSKSHE